MRRIVLVDSGAKKPFPDKDKALQNCGKNYPLVINNLLIACGLYCKQSPRN